jgi:uncharacterized protein
VNWLGLLFESLVVRDLRVYAQALEAQVFACRDEKGLEADAVIEMPDGRWAAFEVRLGQRDVDSAASTSSGSRAASIRMRLARHSCWR